MNRLKSLEQVQNEKRTIIYEMIGSSMELAGKIGIHPLRIGCSCISCVNKRKRIINNQIKNWKFKL